MKTALQQAIDIVKKLATEETHLIKRIEALLPVEKDQMRNMWKDGFNSYPNLDTETGRNRFEKEYQEQYNPNRKPLLTNRTQTKR